jgi:DNA mismatch endonuclease (patch repair protein)
MDPKAAERRRENMRRIRGKDTKPEMLVRRLVHRLGFRYRLHRRDLPGTPDLVFPRHQKVLFVHGCFWHQHSGCRVAHLPKSNLSYWAPKLIGNVKRDAKHLDNLVALGWQTLIVWECEIKNTRALQKRIIRFLAKRR